MYHGKCIIGRRFLTCCQRFFGGTTKPLVFSFSANVPNRSPFAVFGFFFLFFLFSVFFLFIFVWAFLGCLEVDPNWFAMILYLRRCHADSPRSRTDVVFFWGLFPTISHPAFLGFTGLPGRRVRSHNCGLCLSAFSPRNPMPRNFDSRFVFLGGLWFLSILTWEQGIGSRDTTGSIAAWFCRRTNLQLDSVTVQICLAVLQFSLANLQFCSFVFSFAA